MVSRILLLLLVFLCPRTEAFGSSKQHMLVIDVSAKQSTCATTTRAKPCAVDGGGGDLLVPVWGENGVYVRQSARRAFVAAGLLTFLTHSIPAAAADTNTSITAESKNDSTNTPLSTQQRNSTDECDEECKEERRKRIEERRAMMRQSRSSTSRQDVFELSKQRAKLYESEYKGANCVDGIPCI